MDKRKILIRLKNRDGRREVNRKKRKKKYRKRRKWRKER